MGGPQCSPIATSFLGGQGTPNEDEEERGWEAGQGTGLVEKIKSPILSALSTNRESLRAGDSHGGGS